MHSLLPNFNQGLKSGVCTNKKASKSVGYPTDRPTLQHVDFARFSCTTIILIAILTVNGFSQTASSPVKHEQEQSNKETKTTQ
jgi:hypothetical protein